MKNRALPRLAIAISVFAVAGCDSCKKKEDKVKKEVTQKTKSIDEAPAPSDLLGEMVVKDPEALAKRTADGMGFGSDVGPSPWESALKSIPDDNAQRALRAIDPHGAISAVVLMKIGPSEKPHVVLAAKLKDAEAATVAIDTAAKSGGLTAWDSKALETKAYEASKGDVAVYGPYVLAADTREALESAGKYVAFKASKGDGQSRDLSLRIPMDKIGPQLKVLGNAVWAALPRTDLPPKTYAAVDAMISPLLQGIADMGEIALDVDSDGKLSRFDERVAATGTFSTWLTKLAAGDANTMTTMPKADGVSLWRFSDDLAPLIYAGTDDALSKSTLSAADRADLLKQLQALGKSLGHEVDMSNKGSGPSSEFLLRFELGDPASAKTAMAALEKLAIKAMGGAKAPVKTAAYKKFGAEGDEMTLTAGAGLVFHLLWAVRGSYLFVGFSNGGWSIVDAGIDPASTATYATDAAAKAKIASFPGKGVVGASYGDTWSFSKALVPGGAAAAPVGGSGVSWGWTTVDSTGVTAKGEIPLAFIGDMTRFYLGMMAMFGSAPPPY